jgi:hypothetical protein
MGDSLTWRSTGVPDGSEGGVYIKIHTLREAQSLHQGAAAYDALHATDIHPVGVIQQPALRPRPRLLISTGPAGATLIAPCRLITTIINIVKLC